MNSFRVLLVFLHTLFLFGCTGPGNIYTSQLTSCDKTDAKSLTNFDWTKASTIGFIIEDNSFEPSLIELQKNKPYILSVLNKDNVEQWFTATEFFKKSSIGKVIIDEEILTETCPSSIPVRPGKRSKVYLIPRKVDDYTFDHKNMIASSLSNIWGGPINLIFVTRN